MCLIILVASSYYHSMVVVKVRVGSHSSEAVLFLVVMASLDEVVILYLMVLM